MNIHTALVFVLGVALAPLVLSAPGCSLFKTKTDVTAADRMRTTNVASDQNPVAVPVDIAEDINHIRQGWEPRGEGAPSTVAPVAACAPGAMGACHVGQARSPASTGGKSVHYRVRAGDTLMKISFEEYGDVYRWREIYARNKAVISDFNALVAGTELTIDGVEYVVIQRNGQPYLIVKSDTLGKVSRRVYGSSARWRDLWHNNPQLIHDPNKIYAGFTLYYETGPRTPASTPPPAK